MSRNYNIIFTPLDEWGDFVIMKSTLYNNKLIEYLDDENTCD